MTLPLRCLISLGLVGSTVAATHVAHAQPTVRDHRVPAPKRPPPAPPGPVVRDHRAVGPREAPPAPRAENPGKKDGYIWLAGRWRWKDGKWDWLAGHWERPRAKKKWVDGRWEKRGDVYVYVNGRWVADNAAPVPAPPPAPGYTGPRSAPPPPRPEAHARKDGYVWIAGRWQWKNGKWDWIRGHWDRARAKKKWRDGRWEQRGAEWAYVDGAWIDDDGAAAPYAEPRQAPPPPRAETYGKKDGFVWIPGRWQWKDGKWDWLAGHWDRPRAHKKWREGRWEQRGSIWAYVEGEWVDETAAPAPVPPPGPPPVVRDHRRPRRLDRPVVGSYWPTKGKPGTRVVIRGKNFGPDATVIWAGRPLRGAKVEAQRIVFQIPRDAATGGIAVRAGGRVLPVGTFEVAAAFDAAAELAKQEAARRRAAEAAVAARRAKLNADRARRRAEIEAQIAERRANRAQRRAQRVAEIRARWDRAFLASDDAQDELTLHAQRVAQLLRLREVAELAGNTKAQVRIEVASSREDARHEQRMAALKAAFQGGRP